MRRAGLLVFCLTFLALGILPAEAAYRSGGGDAYCNSLPAQAPQPYYTTAPNNCIIERIDNATNRRLCGLGLMGEQLPLPATGLLNNTVAGGLPVCYKFCYFDEAYIQQNPPPWPLNSPPGMAYGTRPTWANKHRVDCPRDQTTGAYTLGPAPTFPKRVACELREIDAAGTQCRKVCKVYETRRGLVKGINYGPSGSEVEIDSGIKNMDIGPDGEPRIIANPVVACPPHP